MPNPAEPPKQMSPPVWIFTGINKFIMHPGDLFFRFVTGYMNSFLYPGENPYRRGHFFQGLLRKGNGRCYTRIE